ncbi:MAG: SagB/ThcOx family dehydrogenase [Deltaproteobacteria bacterium]|nr:SagB/ThcOx family dehydrogenase [Deltaproteobacteria bacterium]
MSILKKTASACIILLALTGSLMAKNKTIPESIKLPPPILNGKFSLEKTLQKRRSVREYSGKKLRLAQVSQLLWAAQGITSSDGMRTAPSAGALYPMEIYLLAGYVENLPQGIYRYRPEEHDMQTVAEGDFRDKLAEAALGQECIKEGAAVIIITAVYERTTVKYRDRGIRYVHMEVGHIAQNIYLQARSLDLGTVFVGAFYDRGVKKVLNIHEEPLGIMPVGTMGKEK